ncbi:hypothetical protein KUTeg_019257 [Tegillarca granosa]|uniref:SOCS box domain-containing protein n=1 Tax=Tegillarca granosa TaxID=220873 RepID=A0ABQ9EG90_TEGGR|nr:hypothetical protein KUTeg_019257 [Tegillarca granosa]
MDFVLIQERPGKKIISVNDTPAHRFLQAVVHGDLVLIKNTLDRKPDILSEQLGLKALFIACEQGDIETIDFLLVKILQKETTKEVEDALSIKNLSIQSLIDSYNENGDTLLSCAARYGYTEICKHLINCGASINQTTQYVHQTPLLVSIENGWTDLASELIHCGADVTITDNVGITPLYAAVKTGDVKTVEELIKAGCDVNVGSQDHAPIFLAARMGLLPIVKCLCEYECHTEVLQYLVNEGCDVNKSDMYDVSPLHIAAMTGNVEALIILINGGADPKLKTHTGLTPLLMAIEKDQSKVVEHMLKMGADILHKPYGSNKSIAVVFDRGFEDTLEVLLRGCAKMPIPHYPGVTEIFSRNGKLLQMLFLSGIQTIPGVLTIQRLHPHYIDNKEISLWLKEYHRNPLSLKGLSRIRIRRCLGNKCLYGANLLPLPNVLKKYICLEEL